MFCLNGTFSVLSDDISPPIDVSSGNWEIGLIEFNTYNSIPNIETRKNNLFYYGESEINIPEGSYEIEDIELYIKSKLPEDVQFELKPNNNTLQVEIFCSEDIHFNKKYNIGPLLGFKAGTYEKNEHHASQLPVDIIKVNSIRIECNVTRGSFINGVQGHIIHEFYPTAPPGYKMIERPRNVIYLPVIAQRINNLTVTITDQNGELINFRGERISVRLHLRQTNGSSI